MVHCILPRESRRTIVSPMIAWVRSSEECSGSRLTSMTLATAHLLTGLVGNDLHAVDSTIEKIALAIGSKPEIDEEAIRALTGGGREFGAFAFGEAVYGRDVREAFRVARNAFREGVEDARGRRVHRSEVVAGRLLWSVQYRLKSVYEARRLLDDGRSEQEVLAALGGPRKPAAIRAIAQAKRFPLKSLREHFILLADAEAELRTPVPEEVVVESLVPKLVGDVDG